MAEQPFSRDTGSRPLDTDLSRLYRRIGQLEALTQAQSVQIEALIEATSATPFVKPAAGDTIETLSEGIPIPADTLIVDDTTGLLLTETNGGAVVSVDVSSQITEATDSTVTSLDDLGFAFRRLLVNLAALLGEDLLDEVLLPHFERGTGEV